MEKVYLDYAATCPLDPEALSAMTPCFGAEYGNPDSLHSFGQSAAYAVTRARDLVAEVLGVSPFEVYFTSGGTEADNWAVRCLNGGEGNALLSAIEHAAVLSAGKMRRGGCGLLPVTEDGKADVSAAEEALSARPALFGVMAVNNETGVIQPVAELSAMCKERGVLFFSDCVQAGNAFDLKELVALCDCVSLSSHKLYGPKGAGALVVKKGVRITPLIAGGEQERGLRGGTLNVAGIVGFAAALRKAQAEREEFFRHTAALRDLFEKEVFSALGDAVRRNGKNRAPNISNLSFSGGGEAMLSMLDLAGVACSGGAACSAHTSLPSHVLLAMGRSEREARTAVRFSFGKETTEKETLFAAERVIGCARRQISSL